MAIRLDDVVLEQMQTNETLERVETKVVGLLSSIDRNLDNFINLWFASKMDEMEAMRERVAGEDSDVGENLRNERDKQDGIGKLGLLGMSAAIAGAFSGFVSGIAEMLNRALKVFQIDLGAKLKAFADGVKALFGPEGKIGKALARVRTGFQSIGTFFGRIAAFFGAEGGLAKMMTSVTNSFKPVGELLSKLGSVFSKFFGIFRILGRIFVPLTAMFEVGKAVFEEFQNMLPGSDWLDNIYAVGRGIIKGVANIILVPLDMVKNAIAWLIEKMVGTDIADAMRGFSFSEMFGKIVDFVTNIGEALLRGAAAAMKALITPGASMKDEFMKQFNHVMSGGAGGAPTDTPPKEITSSGSDRPMTRLEREQAADRRRETMMQNPGRAVDRDGNLIPIEKTYDPSEPYRTREERQHIAEADAYDARMKAVGDTNAMSERLMGASSNGIIGDKIGQEAMNNVVPPMVNVINTSNVNAPSSTVNQDLVSDFTPLPTMNNGSRADAYSAA